MADKAKPSDIGHSGDSMSSQYCHCRAIGVAHLTKRHVDPWRLGTCTHGSREQNSRAKRPRQHECIIGFEPGLAHYTVPGDFARHREADSNSRAFTGVPADERNLLAVETDARTTEELE